MSDPRRALFLAVVRQAIEDAVAPDRDLMDANARRQAHREKKEARRWLTKPNAWLAEVCSLLDLDPERARIKFKAYIDEADRLGFPPPLVFEEIAEHAPIARVDPAIMAKTSPVRSLKVDFPRTKQPRNGITYQGKTLSVMGWAKELHLSPATIREKQRLPLDDVFAATPKGRQPTRLVEHNGEMLSLGQLSARIGIPYATLVTRHHRGLPLTAPIGPTKRRPKALVPGGGSKLPSIGRDRRGSLRAREAEIGVFSRDHLA